MGALGPRGADRRRVTRPAQCDVWLARLDPIAGREQAGTRPVVVISGDAFNAAGWRLCHCVSLSTRDRGSPLHVRIDPPEGGVHATSFALVDQVRALDRSRPAIRGEPSTS